MASVVMATERWRAWLKLRGCRLDVVRAATPPPAGPATAVVASRLGRDATFHHRIACYLHRALRDTKRRGGFLWIAAGSAIDPWVTAAAEIHRVPIVRFAVGRVVDSIDLVLESDRESDRDQIAIALADRVDAIFVRRGGKLEPFLAKRLVDAPESTTRIAVVDQVRSAAAELIARGAIGWWIDPAGLGPRSVAGPARVRDRRPGAEDRSPVSVWAGEPAGDWLSHCTRAPATTWPDETERQYRDGILLGGDDWRPRTAAAALARIVRTGRLVASAVASRRRHPVVCFSALPLSDLLRRRTFRSHLGRWDYEPYGVMIRRRAAESFGMRPVLYGRPRDRPTVPKRDEYRFHPAGKDGRWREEREWRSDRTVPLDQFAPEDLRVFAVNNQESRVLLRGCPWPILWVPSHSPASPSLRIQENRCPPITLPTT